jgi:protein-tyrosine phosphatase
VIDTHCHLLPGVDDGPRTLEHAVALARELVDQGVDSVLCTPHWSSQFPSGYADARRARDNLDAELHNRGIPLRLELAAELSLAYAATQPADELKLRSIRGHLMVELVPDSLPNLVAAVVSRLAADELVPVFAHPERWQAVQRDPSVLDEARSGGALMQLVAPSLTGRWGQQVRDAAWALLGEGRADLLGSDAHDTARRRCELAGARGLVVERLGPACWEQVAVTGPNRLLGEPSSRGD